MSSGMVSRGGHKISPRVTAVMNSRNHSAVATISHDQLSLSQVGPNTSTAWDPRDVSALLVPQAPSWVTLPLGANSFVLMTNVDNSLDPVISLFVVTDLVHYHKRRGKAGVKYQWNVRITFHKRRGKAGVKYQRNVRITFKYASK